MYVAGMAGDVADKTVIEADTLARAQSFFAAIAVEIRRPHFGEVQAGFMKALLLRAQEAHLYTPEQP